MKPVRWEEHRQAGGTLDLGTALKAAREGEPPLPFPEAADAYLEQVQTLAPLKSRQAATLALLEAEKRGQEGSR